MRKLLEAVLVAMTLAGCGGSGGSAGGSTPGTPPVPTAMQIEVSLTREISEVDRMTLVSWNIHVANNGVGLSTAVVTVNGKNVPKLVTFWEGSYYLDYESSPVRTVGEATYLVGADYNVVVTVNGTTYSDTLRVPGGFTIDAACTNVAWAQAGNYATILVTHLFGTTTFTSSTLGSPATLTSPQAIPARAYPSADTYQVTAVVQNEKRPPNAYPGNGYFSTLVGPNTSFIIQDSIIKRVVK